MRLRLHNDAGEKMATAEAEAGQTFAQAVWLTPGIEPRPLCGSLSLCGRCRMRFLNDAPEAVEVEKEFFSSRDLAEGWRLGCRHIVPQEDGELDILLPEGAFSPAPKTCFHSIIAQNGWLGIDLGTTSIQWRCVNDRGETLAENSLLNPQAAAGPDVISRLKFSALPQRRDLLSNLVLAKISHIVATLGEMGIEIRRLCIAANSVMSHILLKCDIAGLSSAPYRMACPSGHTLSLELAQGLLPCVIPPLPAPFIGGDLSAGLLALIKEGVREPMILADLGTNAELALLLPGRKLFLASVPLGPALEGIGPQCGQGAGPGAAVDFSLGATGLVPIFFNNAPGGSISATGYLSLLSHLLDLGVMDGKGHFIHMPAQMPLGRRIQKGFIKDRNQDRLQINGELFLTAHDVELLLKVKAVFRLALSRILKSAHMEWGEIESLVLAGAISENVRPGDLANLGFIPRLMTRKLILAGNSSLKGACLLARDPAELPGLASLCDSAEIIDMANDPAFLNDYLEEMTWQ